MRRIEVETGIESIRGIPGLDVDQAGERVGAVARTLGTAQHLDLFHVDHGRNGAGTAEVHVVDEETHRCVDGADELAAFADTANLEKPRPRSAAGVIDVGNGIDDVLEVPRLAGLDDFLCENTDAGSCFDYARRTEICRDDNFRDRVRVSGQREAGQQDCWKDELVHEPLPMLTKRDPVTDVGRVKVEVSSFSSAGISRIRF